MTTKEEKKGDCFFVALQMIHDHGRDDDPIPEILREHNIDVSGLDMTKIFLVHGEGVVKTPEGKQKIGRHAWVELDGLVIDYSNRSRIVEPDASTYYTNLQIQPAIRLQLQEVLSLLLFDPKLERGFYWGVYSRDDLDRITREYDASTYSSWDRNFLQEYDQQHP